MKNFPRTIGRWFIILGLAFSGKVFAQTITSIGELKDAVLCQALDWIYTIAIFLAIIFVLVAAYRYITSAGEPEKLKSARNTVIYAGVGVAVALLAWSVPYITSTFIFGNTTALSEVTCPGSGLSGGQPPGTISSP